MRYWKVRIGWRNYNGNFCEAGMELDFPAVPTAEKAVGETAKTRQCEKELWTYIHCELVEQ